MKNIPYQNDWFVLVNGKYMVRAHFDEEISALGAEHFFLDNIRAGIHDAQAFNKEEMKTDFFRDNLMACKLVSVEEIRELSNEFYDNCIRPYEDEIEKLEEQIAERRTRLMELKTVLLNVKAKSF